MQITFFITYGQFLIILVSTFLSSKGWVPSRPLWICRALPLAFSRESPFLQSFNSDTLLLAWTILLIFPSVCHSFSSRIWAFRWLPRAQLLSLWIFLPVDPRPAASPVGHCIVSWAVHNWYLSFLLHLLPASFAAPFRAAPYCCYRCRWGPSDSDSRHRIRSFGGIVRTFPASASNFSWFARMGDFKISNPCRCCGRRGTGWLAACAEGSSIEDKCYKYWIQFN